MIVLKIVSALVIGYLLGSIAFGVIMGRLWTRQDVRSYGSGRTGATNVLRTAGYRAAVPTVLLDIGKGALAFHVARFIMGADTVMIGGYALGVPLVAGLAGLAAVMGHVWPIFLKFKGGRGVSVVFGMMLMVHWPAALAGFVLGISTVFISRYVSLGSLVMASSVAIVSIVYYARGALRLEFLIVGLISTALLFLWHKDNIRRLLAGSERRIGQRVPLEQTLSDDGDDAGQDSA